MAQPKWHVKGDFYGNCSCDFLRCACPTSSFTEAPTNGWCRLSIVFSVDTGHFDDVTLDGCQLVLVCDIPGAMADGNWSLGLIFGDQASPEQQQALGAVFGGQAGGPMAAMAGWIGNFLGAETRPIRFEKDGANRSLSIPDMVDINAEGIVGENGAQLAWDNVTHPANSRVELGRGVRTSIHAFGIDFDGEEGRTSAVMCPFEWEVA